MQLCVEVTRAWIASVIELALLGANVTLVARKAVMILLCKPKFLLPEKLLNKIEKVLLQNTFKRIGTLKNLAVWLHFFAHSCRIYRWSNL